MKVPHPGVQSERAESRAENPGACRARDRSACKACAGREKSCKEKRAGKAHGRARRFEVLVGDGSLGECVDDDGKRPKRKQQKHEFEPVPAHHRELGQGLCGEKPFVQGLSKFPAKSGKRIGYGGLGKNLKPRARLEQGRPLCETGKTSAHEGDVALASTAAGRSAGGDFVQEHAAHARSRGEQSGKREKSAERKQTG